MPSSRWTVAEVPHGQVVGDALAIGVEAREQAHVVAPRARLAGDEFDQRQHEHTQQALDVDRGSLGLERVEQRAAAALDRLHPAQHDRFDQRFARTEVVVDGGRVHARFPAHLAQGHPLEPAVREQPLGGVEDLRARLGRHGGHATSINRFNQVIETRERERSGKGLDSK